MSGKHGISSKILHRTREAVKQFDHTWNKYVDVKMSRDAAHRRRKELIAVNGGTAISSSLMKAIKAYSQNAFGSRAYWPWLAVYTELRGAFCEGWIPQDYYRFELLPRLNPEKFMRFSEAKSFDHKIFNDCIVEPLLLRSNNQFCDKNGNLKSREEVQNYLAGLNQEIIIKPDAGRGGDSIIFRHSTQLNLDDLPANSDLVIQKVVTQHPEMNRLYPHSINTFRVMTYLDQTGKIEVKFIIIRFGVGGSRVDNTSNGGGWIFIQQDGTPEPEGYDAYGFPIGTHHPDTGTRYAGLQLPFLNKITALCKKAHRNFPYTRIIGWDAFINEGEEAKLIEWNANNPFWCSIEAHFGPFLKELVTDNTLSTSGKH